MRGKRKHVPMRTCVVCRNKFEKRNLVRVVNADDGVHVDPTGKQEGRGAYLCHDAACWQRAAESNILSKALRAELSPQSREMLLQVFRDTIMRQPS